MPFEYDPAKSQSNQEKHGIDFEQAQQLWLDPMALVVPARISGEPRWQLIGRMGGKTWSAYYTVREDKIRLISVRRARDDEKEKYENYH